MGDVFGSGQNVLSLEVPPTGSVTFTRAAADPPETKEPAPDQPLPVEGVSIRLVTGSVLILTGEQDVLVVGPILANGVDSALDRSRRPVVDVRHCE